jgi:hypothetical protein
MKYLIISFSILILASCNFIRIIEFIRAGEPNESRKEVARFLKKKRYKHDYSLFLNDSISNLLRTEKYKLNTAKDSNFSLIQLRIYDSIGHLYSGYSQCMGSFEDKKLLSQFPPAKNQYPYLNEVLFFENELTLIDDSDYLLCEIKEEAKQYKYTYVVYYAMWGKYFSERLLKRVSKVKSEFPDDVLVILVNVSR